MTRTFSTKRAAVEWARGVEAAIDAGSVPKSAATVRLGHLIREYLRLRAEGGREVSPTSNTSYMLRHLAEDLGSERVVDLTPERLVRWARMRHEQGAGGYTVNMELSCLGTTLRHAGSFLGLQLPDVVGQARPLLTHLQLIAGGNRRTRRPTEDELHAVLQWVEQRDRVAADAMRVAAITGLRRSEVAVKLRWDRLDATRRAALIIERKHPRRHMARDEWVPLLGESWSIVQRQPRTGERVFPVSPEKLTDLFTAAVRGLGIENLRFHDLRHLASSTLQELGFDDVERMAIVGHRGVHMNARYTHPSLEHLHAKYESATKAAAKKARRPGTTT